ncbi:hypothetical protein, partial [Vibrio parahaemolyticus]
LNNKMSLNEVSSLAGADQLKSKLNNQQCFKFFTELKLHVNNSHQSAISDYLANPLGSYDVSYLFSAI